MSKFRWRGRSLTKDISAVLTAKVLALAAIYFAFFASKPALPGAARWLFGP
ncbi:cytochrome oxidase putative small subunit CydP [Methylocystis sp. SC2]|uniref:cytochrome oxidase putative small subunit CydP n=1 Tax=Methylocystis sp. (strain SC2) TaxID=187303 RepID=UPI0002EE7FA3|nr:cytochrome oxidase putative small subunit CydP [Methylocystis sp. SC2]